ncbi:MAG: DUF5654 family protein, partial [Nanoarchaeota archaeon]
QNTFVKVTKQNLLRKGSQNGNKLKMTENKEVEKKNREILELTREKAKLSAQLAGQKAKNHFNSFRMEFRKAAGTAIIAAFSFLIALAWKDFITGYIDKLSLSLSPIQSQALSTLIVTVVCVLGIIITTRILSVEDLDPKKLLE